MTEPCDAIDDTGHAEGEVFDPAGHRPSPRALAWVGAGVCLVAAGVLAVGIVPRMHQRTALAVEERRAAADTPQVLVARAERSATASGLVLPGSVQPLQETRIYARASGYVRKWHVDIGARVKKGDVLVELDIPDVDEQLRQAQAAETQARAGVEQARSQLVLAKANQGRTTKLAPSGVVSQQEVDQVEASLGVQQANVAAAQAALGSAEAAVRRYADLRSFGTITAPFDGVVTMRSAEVGQLVTAGTGQGDALFKVAEVDVVRVFVNVPQLYAAGIQVGMDAPTTMRETPGRVYAGKVARTANELDMTTRTLLTEVDIPNPDGSLVAGMYAKVSFDVKRQDRPLIVPSTAVVFDAQGTRAATVREGVVAWKKVTVDGDLGDRLAVASGLDEGDLVAVVPSERLVEGMHVTSRANEPGEKPSASAGKAP